MSINRRKLIKTSAVASAAMAMMNNRLLGAEDAPNPKSNRFLIYIHFGSSCGAANGLLQPIAPSKWPLGFFENGLATQAANPLLNSHTQAGGLVFHDYHKFMAPMADQMCLVEGTSQSLDHNVARLLQTRGSGTTSTSPEWAMGVTQFMKTTNRLNPMVITGANKTASVADVTTVQANDMKKFQEITSDDTNIPQNMDPIWSALKTRFKKPGLSSVLADATLDASSTYQLNTLQAGLPELAKAKGDIDTLRAALGEANVRKLVDACADKNEIINRSNENNGFKEKLILAGILAKTGLANGMTIDVIGEDLHGGGADVVTARSSAAAWAAINLFWTWIKSAGLQDDVMIVVGQEFARSPYNKDSQDFDVIKADGSKVRVRSPGRDHALAMGMMFINAGVPKSGRIGFVGDNMVPQATKDAKGTIEASGAPYTSENIVGSMLLRTFSDLFPTERMVRKHWPTFKEIAPITA